MLGLGTSLCKYDIMEYGPDSAEPYTSSIVLDGANDRLDASRTGSFIQDFGANSSWSIRFQIEIDQPIPPTSLFIGSAGPVSDVLTFEVTGSNHGSGAGNLRIAHIVSGTTVLDTHFDTNIVQDTWTELVLTCDASGTNRVFSCYQNGLAASKTDTILRASSSSMLPGSRTLTLGTWLNAAFFAFKIDNIASWSSVLTAAEAQEIYRSHPLLTSDHGDYSASSNLTTYYTMEEGSGTTTSDVSGNSADDITLTNGPTWSSDTMF